MFYCVLTGVVVVWCYFCLSWLLGGGLGCEMVVGLVFIARHFVVCVGLCSYSACRLVVL